ncbi:MAG: hypothetical protein JJ902_19620 [Roseibium sp.]|nr:hypothetical protein [Roseibium sp.]
MSSAEGKIDGRYMSLMFLKIDDSYFAMNEKERSEVTKGHVDTLSEYNKNLTHVLCMGFSGKYDQINLLEADDLETLYRMTEDFKMGTKGRHIEIVDAVVGIKVNNKRAFNMVGSR